MKVFIAGIDTETNTFAALPTGYLTFSDGFLAHGDATKREPNYCSSQLIVWRQLAEECGWQVTESICAVAEPGGLVVRAAYERLRDELLTDLERNLPFDIVILALHGAMVAEGYDDCEGDLLGHVRRIVGSKAIVGAELDLHCHLTESMMRHATVLLTYKEYPHVDIAERAEDLFKDSRRHGRGNCVSHYGRLRLSNGEHVSHNGGAAARLRRSNVRNGRE